MIRLLTVSQWVTDASDFLTAKWPEILAILTSSTFIIGLITFLSKLILIRVSSKTKAKYQKPIEEKYNELKVQNDLFMKNTLEMFNLFIERVNDAILKAKEKEIEVNKQFYAEVMDEETEKVVKDIIEKEIENPKVEEMPPKTEEVVVDDKLVEENEKVANESENGAKTTYVVAKKVIGGE